MEPFPRTWIDVDLGALTDNIAAIKRRLPPEVAFALVAKADGYGHGLVPVCRAATQAGADWIAIATVQEGVALRDAGILKPIMVMSPVLEVEAEQAVFYDLHVFVENVELAKSLSDAAVSMNRTARVHLKVDTGLHRYGCAPEDAGQIAKQILELPNLELYGISQHFADSAQDAAVTDRQMQRFRTALVSCMNQGVTFTVIHMSNSAGTVKYPEARGNLVRVGIISYGIDPFFLMGGEIKPVMAWHARLTSIRKVAPGEKVGYAGTYTVERPSVIGTLGVGYGDGYARALSNAGFVALDGHIAPIRGLVCMDQMMIDLTDIPNPKVGQVVELIGPHVKVEDLAKAAKTNVHEIVTRIMTRVSKRYTYPSKRPVITPETEAV